MGAYIGHKYSVKRAQLLNKLKSVKLTQKFFLEQNEIKESKRTKIRYCHAMFANNRAQFN